MSDESRSESEDSKRVGRNELKRRRRKSMEREFEGLKKAIPSIRGKANVSKCTILKETIKHIKRNKPQLKRAFALQEENEQLEKDIEVLERAKETRDLEAVKAIFLKYGVSKCDYEDDTLDLEMPLKKPTLSSLGCVDEWQDLSDSGDESLHESEDNSDAVTSDLCESRLESESERSLAYSRIQNF